MFTFIVMVVPVVIITFLAIVVAKKSALRRAKEYFIALLVTLIGLSIITYLSIAYTNSQFGIWYVRGVMTFAVLVTYSFFNFVFAFPNERPQSSAMRNTSRLIAVLVAIFCLSPYVFGGIQFLDGNYTPTIRFGIILFGITTIGFIVAGLTVLLRRYKVKKGIEKMQIGYITLGFGVMFILMLTFNFFGFLLTERGDFNRFTALFTIPFVATTAYTMVRYRLMDISIVIRKSAVQLLTFILLFAIYAYALLLVQRGSSPAVSLSSNTSLLITIFIIAITIEPLRKFIYKWIDGLFANKERLRQESLQRLQMVSASTTQFQSLLTRTEDELSKAIGQKPAFLMVDRQRQEIMAQDGKTSLGQLDSAVMQKILTGKILIADELSYRIENGETSLQPVQAWFGKHQFAAVVPLGSGEECIGLFAFPQRGNAVFTTDIVHFLKSFQDQLQFAFANALAYKQAIERITALKH